MIRISLGSMPSLLREIVASALSVQTDFALEAARPGEDGTPDCDVLVLCPQASDNLRIALDEAARPISPVIVALDPDGELAAILDIATNRQMLSTPGDLSGVIRRAAEARSVS